MHAVRTKTRCFGWFVALAVLALGGPAQATEAEHRARADALFRQGIQLADQGKLDAAIEKLVASYELDPARGTLLGLAMAEEQLGRVLDAQTHFRELHDAAVNAGDKDREKIADSHLELLRPRVPTLTLSFAGTPPADTRLFIDDQKLPLAVLETALPVNPGDHRVSARTGTGAFFSRRIGVSEGARTRVEIAFSNPITSAPRQQADESASSSRRTWAYASLGAATALLLVGVYVSVENSNVRNDETWQDYAKTVPTSENICDYAESQDRQDIVDRCQSVHRNQMIALITLPLGVLAAGTGIYLLATEPERPKTRALSLTPAFGPEGGGLRLNGRF